MNPMNIVNLSSILLVAAGGAVGCVGRFLVIRQVARLNPTIFPLGTMVVNILGSMLMGLILARYGTQHSARIFLVNGMAAGFTTFAAFSWDVTQLLHRGQYMQAGVYITGSVVLAVACLMLGWKLAQ